jgi:hypothetical protein
LGSGFPLLFFCNFCHDIFHTLSEQFQPHSNWLLFSDSSIADKSVIPVEKKSAATTRWGTYRGMRGSVLAVLRNSSQDSSCNIWAQWKWPQKFVKLWTKNVIWITSEIIHEINKYPKKKYWL